jgi:hypothetical protein
MFTHSNVSLSLFSPAYSKNSPSFHCCAPTTTLSVNVLYITITNTITAITDIILPIELT